jgi:hypothetical protein
MTARKNPLRAVTDADKPATPPVPMTITEAAEADDPIELLMAMRRRVAETVEDPNCPPRDLAALTRRLQEIGKEIQAMKAKSKQEAEEDGDSRTPDEEWDAEAI